MKDAVATMGDILPDDVSGRDAVHVAVVSVTAAVHLSPGQDVGFVVYEENLVGPSDDPIGIVDPFIKNTVMSGDRFWLFLYPRTITGLTHSWTHPAFADESPKLKKNAKVNDKYSPPSKVLESEQWLKNYCSQYDVPDYYDILSLVQNNTDNEYITVYGSDAHGAIPDEFWKHVENVLGKEIKYRPKYFSCSC